ncbi:uncharacterized protein OCT59_026637 [Rhizophagus irregularis]|uniref:uncharacterized protein n=1 Tax=Rhizophagus irregularis TaxID=588596 RepID=UPI000CB2CECC|nr:hypothetical protein OCT59_026637 [Rhizophagus irregularis]
MVRGNFRARRAKISQKKRRQWSAREKLIVIAYYEQGHSKRSTADKFEIEPKQLRNWLKNKDQLMIVAPYVRKLVQGARPKYQQLETELIEWWINFSLLDVSLNNLLKLRCDIFMITG